MQPLTFALYRGGRLVGRETVTQQVLKIGKDPRSHLRVDDQLASRMHAVIEVTEPDQAVIIDLGSEAGTIVNGKRVNKAKLRTGDQVQIGSTTLVLEGAGAPAYEQAAVDPHRDALGAALSRIDALEEENRALRDGRVAAPAKPPAPAAATKQQPACVSCGSHRTLAAKLVRKPGQLEVGDTDLDLAQARVCADCGHVALFLDGGARTWLDEHYLGAVIKQGND